MEVKAEQSEEGRKAPIPFVLPVLELSDTRIFEARDALEKIRSARSFSPRVLAYAMQNKLSHCAIKRYLQAFNADQLKVAINQPIYSKTFDLGVPVLFYAVESGSEEYVRLLHDFGADIQAQTSHWKIGVLAYTILHSSVDLRDTTETFRLLIGLGADPTQIQKSLWEHHTKPMTKLIREDITPREKSEACIQNSIASAINVTQRYLLRAAYANGSPVLPGRTLREATQLFSIDRVLEISYAIIGQPIAKKLLIQKFTAYHILRQYETKPIVMALTGIKGHGKTELAKQLGMILDCRFHYVNCREMTTEIELFGPRPFSPEFGETSSLNGFLNGNEGKRCIVFLDEFDESNEEIRTALLQLLDKGKYKERRRGRELSPGLNTIWIMAMRGSLETLSRFIQEFEKLGDDFLDKAPLEDLQFKLSNDVIGQVGAQIAGCIQGVIPFFPFSKYEAAVVAHSFLLKRIREYREPFSRKDKKIIGDLHIDLFDDDGICKLVAESYVKEVGASSLDTAVTRLLMEPIAKLAVIGSTGLAADPEATRSLKRNAVFIAETEVSKKRKMNVLEDGRVELISALPKPKEPLFTTQEWNDIRELNDFM